MPRGIVVMVNVELPEPLTGFGENVVLTPLGSPPTLRVTASPNPPVAATVTVNDLLCPDFMLAELGEIESEKSGLAGACTVRVTVVLWINVPLAPEMVTV